ncbi:MAG: nucleotide exchange factor GrpE [Anaeroplasmataceae bacterium]
MSEEIKEAVSKEMNETEEEFAPADEEALENEKKATEEKKADETKTAKKEVKSKHKQEIEKLNAEIEKLKNENLKIRDDYLRARADMENTKRRLNEEAILNRKYASMKLVETLVTPVDMLVKVCASEQTNPELNNFLIGFKMISNQLVDALQADGLKEIEALGKEFDPNVHHAISKEHKDGVEPNMVIEVLQVGYKYKDRLLRPAMVKVSE